MPRHSFARGSCHLTGLGRYANRNRTSRAPVLDRPTLRQLTNNARPRRGSNCASGNSLRVGCPPAIGRRESLRRRSRVASRCRGRILFLALSRTSLGHGFCSNLCINGCNLWSYLLGLRSSDEPSVELIVIINAEFSGIAVPKFRIGPVTILPLQAFETRLQGHIVC